MADIINQIKVKENHKRQEIMLEGENDESSSSGSDSDPSDDEFEVNYFNSNIQDDEKKAIEKRILLVINNFSKMVTKGVSESFFKDLVTVKMPSTANNPSRQ